MVKNFNFSNVFLRDCIVGTLSYLYDTVKIINIEENEKEVEINVPIYYSANGQEQFIRELFLNTDKYCNELTPKIEGNTRTYPRGVLLLKSADIIEGELMHGYSRMVHLEKIETDFGDEMREMNSRGDLIPIKLNFDLTFRTNNEIERFKIWDYLIEEFYKVRKFFIRHKGFEAIPCLIGFPESMSIDKTTSFSYDSPQEKLEMSVSLEVVSYKPVIDKRTTYHANNHLKNPQVKITPK